MIKYFIFLLLTITVYTESLIFSTVNLSEKSSSTQIIAKKVLEEAYGSLGYTFLIKPISGERAIWSANKGDYDGELYRVKDIEPLYENLIKVNVPLTKLDMISFYKIGKKEILTWEDLRGMKIAYPIGIKILELNLMSFENVYPTPTYDKLFMLLESNRVDYIILDRLNGEKVLKNLKYKDITTNNKPLISVELFHYLNIKHEKLVIPLEKKLLEMEKNGDIERINLEVINDY